MQCQHLARFRYAGRAAPEDFIDTLCEQALQRQAISVQIVPRRRSTLDECGDKALRQRLSLAGSFPDGSGLTASRCRNGRQDP